jgi:hypothetical protein
MSFINYTTYSANPHFQVPHIIQYPPSGTSASITSSIPTAPRSVYALAVGNTQPVNNESAGLSAVRSTSSFALQMAPALLNSQSEGYAVPAPL